MGIRFASFKTICDRRWRLPKSDKTSNKGHKLGWNYHQSLTLIFKGSFIFSNRLFLGL